LWYKKETENMKTYIPHNPANEMVLYYYRDRWEVLGPLVAQKADLVASWFNGVGYSAFICLEEDFVNLGLPSDLSAQPYFEEPPSWNKWTRLASTRNGKSIAGEESRLMAGHLSGHEREIRPEHSLMEPL
jgi:hypothetical protein